MKKKVAATRIIAAAETRISAVELDLVDSFGWDEADASLASDAEGSTAGTAACAGVVTAWE